MANETGDDVKVFREEYLALERSVERYVSVYLSALAVAATWLLGPASVDPRTILSGHGGSNIYSVITLALVNLVLVCVVLFKGIQIHEVMQFATVRSPKTSVIDGWEIWRRHPFSLSKPIRVLHYGISSGFPLLAGLTL